MAYVSLDISTDEIDPVAYRVSEGSLGMTSLLNMVKTLANGEPVPPAKNEAVMVAESLLCEMDFQMRELEEVRRQEEKERRKQKCGVDYSWLVSAQPRGMACL